MKKLFLISFMALLFSLLLAPQLLQADAVLPPANPNMTWTITTPALNAYYATSPYYTVGVSDTAYSLYWTNKNPAVRDNVNTRIEVQSTIGSYTQTIALTDVAGYNNTFTNFKTSSYFSGIVLQSDTRVRFQFVFDGVAGYTSSETVNTHLENNVNVYLYSVLAPAFATNDSLTYWAGFDNGEDVGYAKGYKVGQDDTAQSIFDNGVSEFDYIQANSKDYLDGINAGDIVSYEKGYIDGGNDSFQANIGDWIVPAIVIVLIVGGIIGMRQMRKRND